MKTKVNNIKNRRLTKKQEALLWRRNKVLQMSMAGMTQMDIADALKVSQASISLDIADIKEESRQQLQSVITEIIPLQWRRTRTELQFIERETLQIWKNAKTDSGKLAALSLFSDTYQKEFELCVNSTIIDEALKFVNSDHIDKVLQKLKEKEGEGEKENNDPELRSDPTEFQENIREEENSS